MSMCARSLATLAVGVALTVAVAGSAGAGKLSTSAQQIRYTWAAWTVMSSSGNITCPLTLEGSFHARTIAKVSSVLVGYMSRGTIGSCTGGNVTLLGANFPWHMRYASFSGTLPTITAVELAYAGMAFLASGPLGLSCLYDTSSSAVHAIDIVDAQYRVTGIRWRESDRIPPHSGSFCPDATLGGTGSVSQAGFLTAISLTLI